MIRDLTSTAHPIKSTQKSRKTAFWGKIFVACGAPKKEGELATLAERDPPSDSHPCRSGAPVPGPCLWSLRKSPICVRCRISRATDLSLPLLASDKVLGLHRTRCVLERSQELPQSMKTCSRGGARLSSPVSPDALRRTGQCRGTIMQRCKWLRLCDVPVMDAGVSWTVALFSGAREGTFNLDSLLAHTLPVPIDACPG